MPTAGIPTRARARLYASRRVVFVLVNMEGDVGSVSRYTEIGSSNGGEEEVGFNVAEKKRSFFSPNFGTGAGSTVMSPCFDKRMRIYIEMSLTKRIAKLYCSAPCRVGSCPCPSTTRHNGSRANEGRALMAWPKNVPLRL
jgi:hypothetical protein